MKRGALNHPKIFTLAASLNIEVWGAIGIAESICQFGQLFAKRGDIGRWTNEEIANGIGWKGKPDELINALIQRRWVDQCVCHRLRIHDWPDHADQTLKRSEEIVTYGFIECYGDDSKLLVSASDLQRVHGEGEAYGEGEGKGKAEGRKAKKPDPEIEFPPSLDNETFRSAFRKWQDHRKQIKKPLTPSMIESLFDEWKNRPVAEFVDAVQFTRSKGWQGLAERNDNGRSGTSQNQQGRSPARPETPRGKYSNERIGAITIQAGQSGGEDTSDSRPGQE